MSEHEERLRAALRHGAGSPGDPQDPYDTGPLDTASMLDRVRRGARRRRARRTVGGVVAVGAVVAALSVAVPAVLDDGGRTPAADDGPTGDGALVQTVSAAGDSVWATVRVDCETGTCPALARSSDNGDTWAVAALQPTGNAGQTFTAQRVELAGTAVDGWAWNQTTLIASHDAGESWSAGRTARGRPGLRGRRRQRPGGGLHALGDLASKQVLSVSEVSDDRWAPIPAAVRPDEMVTRVFAGGDMLGAVLGSRVTARAHTLLLDPPGAGWERHPVPCRAQGEVFADTDGETLWTACLGGGSTLLADSTDGSAWDTVQLPAIIGRVSMAARDDGSVLLAGPDQSFVVDAEGIVDEIDPPAGDPQAAGVTDDGYGAAASGDADWLVSTGGRLLGSTDDGASWARVPVE